MSVFDVALASFVPKRAIGQFTAQITIDEVCEDELEITENPVEQGASISDHAYVKPSTVAVRIVFGTGAQNNTLVETYQSILQLQASREPFDVITGKRSYNNMLIKTLVVTNNVETEHILSIRMLLQQVFIVSLEVSSVPDAANQKTPQSTEQIQNTGEKSPKAADQTRSQSILDIIARG